MVLGGGENEGWQEAGTSMCALLRPHRWEGQACSCNLVTIKPDDGCHDTNRNSRDSVELVHLAVCFGPLLDAHSPPAPLSHCAGEETGTRGG